ncbi:MAG: hypothetical protein QOG15_1214 [Solirubrobacteraceae bacterium]|jgi:phage baseplate assembly protein gpV|nr:hypothetical protein [Solirubrobacteraceae bacterium]
MASDGLQRARVSGVDDPQGLGRVTLKGLRGSSADAWAPMATVAAPAVGDEVLVAHEEDDPRRPVVVGSLRRDELELRFGGSEVALGPDGVVRIEDANGNAITLAPSGITITAAAKVDVQASQVHVSAGTVTVDAGMSQFSGVVQCDTLIATSVVAQSYTPGIGNIQ